VLPDHCHGSRQLGLICLFTARLELGLRSALGLGRSVWPVVPVASLVYRYAPSSLVIISSFLTRQISCMMIM